MPKWVTHTSATAATLKPASAASILAARFNFVLTALIIAALAQTTVGFRPIESSLGSGEGRKLFGGYRITPKHCRATRTLPFSDPRANGPTICMFNHECAQRNGEVVGACMDGFLFGACCQIPNSQELESTLIKDAQNAYYQQHQQQKLQTQHAASNPAAALSYENYGESSMQQQSQENKYPEPAKPQQQQSEDASSNYASTQHDIFEQENIDKVYQQLDSSSSYAQQQQQVTGNSNQLQDALPSSSNIVQDAPPFISHIGVQEQLPQSVAQQQSEQQDTSDTSAQSEQQQNGSSSTEASQSGSLELDSEANLQPNLEVANTNTIAVIRPPEIHVNKHSVKVSSPSSPPHNDDFVMQVLNTLPPENQGDLVTFTTEVPMKISSSIIDQTSSESNSFEEEPPATQAPVRRVDKPVKDVEAQPTKPTQETHTPQQQQQQQHQQQQQKPHQQHHHKPQHSNVQQQHLVSHQPDHPQQQQQQEPTSNMHHHNHLQLDGGEFTHSSITHPGADADLVEEDLQFSTGYGPQPVYVQSPNKETSDTSYSPSTTLKTPVPEDKYMLMQTSSNEQLNKKAPASGNPTPSSGISTHVDSIESIILQLNNTNHGPAYSVVNQPTPTYGAEGSSDLSFANDYEHQTSYYEPNPTTTLKPLALAYTTVPSTYYEEIETKRPDDTYLDEELQDQQRYPAAQTQVPAYLEPVTTNLNLNTDSVATYDAVSNEKEQNIQDYEQSLYSSPKPAAIAPAPSYSDETAILLEDHTMPANNYNDVSASGTQTSEFNKMPAVGIAYPVDMSYMDEESNIVLDADKQSAYAEQSESPVPQISQDPVESSTPFSRPAVSTYQKQPEPQPVPNYTSLPSVHDHQHRPIASYIGVVTSQNYNSQQPQASGYSPVPNEVSVSSHTTQVQEDYETSPSYQSPESEKYTTLNYFESPISTPLPPTAKPTAASQISSSSTPLVSYPEYEYTTTVSTTSRPVLVTAKPTRPRPRPKPATKRPTKRPQSTSTNKRPSKPAKPQASKRPVQPINTYNQEPQSQPSTNYNQVKQPTNTYNDAVTHIKKPAAQQPTNTYNQQTAPSASKPVNSYQEEAVHIQRPAVQPSGTYNAEPVKTKKPASPPTNTYQQSQPQYTHKQPAALNTHSTKQPTPTVPSYEYEPDYNQQPIAQPAHTYNQETHIKRPAAQTPVKPKPINAYQPQEATFVNGPAVQPTNIYNTEPEKDVYQEDFIEQQTASTSYGQDSNAVVQSPQPSLSYNQEQQVASTPINRPPATRRPVQKKPSNKPTYTSYVTGSPTPRPVTTFLYHDDAVPPLVVADDKLDSFLHSTAEAGAGVTPTASAYQPTVFIASVTPVNVQRPQNTYNTYKKPGFVKVQSTVSPPLPTVLITPKPNVNIVTSSSWTQRPNGGTSYINNAYPPTTPIPAFGSTSYIFSPVGTRRPDLPVITSDYVTLSSVTSNDFDDPGYFGAQNSVHPAFTQATTEATYAVPSDDRPAFPGYYGPTPTYPAFQVPGAEKLGAPVAEEETSTSPNDAINFPPVRNPNLNMSATSSAVTTDLELSTPAFVEDGVLKDKMNTLVHKIVESLQGNFDALADMIDDVNNTAAVPSSTYHAAQQSTTSVTRKPTRKPTRVTTAKPKATTKKPVTRVTTKKPAVTTRRPTTRRPTTTTRKPSRKPTRKTTTTTSAPIEEEIVDEEDEEDINPSENEVDQDETISTAGAGGRKIQCGVRPHVKSGRIVGGKGSTFGAFPWQVLVRESTWLGLFTKNKCGGVLITNRYIITAAHCQPGFLASLVAVMGEYDISGDLESKRAVTKNVKRVIVHRQYDPATFENDLALLELESPVEFDSHIVPICMPNDSADFTGRMATVTGWGRLKYGGGVPSVLQEVQVPVIENSVCQEMFHTAGHNKKILGSFLCAGYANGQKDSCEGDSGGPLVLQRPDGRYELAGTVSHGIKCAAPYLPGVYMRTTFYKPWLKSITGVK